MSGTHAFQARRQAATVLVTLALLLALTGCLQIPPPSPTPGPMATGTLLLTHTTAAPPTPKQTSTPNPTDTATPTPAPTESAETLKDRAAVACDAALGREAGGGAPQAPLLTLLNATYLSNGWEYAPFPHLDALRPGDVRTLACVEQTRIARSKYNDGAAGFARQWSVSLVSWPGGEVLQRQAFTGGSPPVFKTRAGAAYGSAPRERAYAWLLSLVPAEGVLYSEDMHLVTALAFSPDGKTLVSGGSGGQVRLWDVTTGQQLRELEGLSENVVSAVYSPDGQRIAASSDVMALWDANTGQTALTIEGAGREIAFSPDGTLLAAASHDVQIYDAASMSVLRTLDGHEDLVMGIAFAPDGATLTTSSRDHTMAVWDVATGERLRSETVIGDVEDLAYSPDGRLLAGGGYRVKLWDAASGERLRNFDIRSYSLAFSPDGGLLAIGGSARVSLWPVSLETPADTAWLDMRALDGHRDSVHTITFSPDGRTLASAGRDGTIRLWDVASALHEPAAVAAATPRPTTAPAGAATPAARPSTSLPDWPVVLEDGFERWAHDWAVGAESNDYVIIAWTLKDEAYHWSVRAHQGVHWYTYPDVRPLADFGLSVEAQQLSGPKSAEYGVVFRVRGDDFYYFAISNSGHYHLARKVSGQWTELVGWTLSDAIRPGEVNGIAIVGQGARFSCYINDTLVLEIEDEAIGDGLVGVAMQLQRAGDVAVFAFDNFQLRAP